MNFADMDRICQVDPKTLYASAQKQGLPFYAWPKWIEAELRKIYLEKVYRERQMLRGQAIKESKNGRQELQSHGYYAEFKVIDNYLYHN